MSNDKTFDPMLLANFLVFLSNKENKDITNLKLQKILFFVNAKYLLDNNGKPLMNEEFQRWIYGPVMYSVYENFRYFGSDPILQLIGTYVYENNNPFLANYREFKPTQLPSEIRSLTKKVFNSLIDMDPFKLVKYTHQENLWSEYVKDINNRTAPNYKNSEIYQYFLDHPEAKVWEHKS